MNDLLATPVTEIMTTKVETVSETAQLREAARLIGDKHVAGLPVTSLEGRLVGVIAWSDILRAAGIMPTGAKLSGDPLHGIYAHGDVNVVFPWLPPLENISGVVRDCMSTRLIVIPLDATVATAIKVMDARGVHRVLVVDDKNNLAGVVSAIDIVRLLARSAASSAA